MTKWISTEKANKIADSGVTDRRFRDKFRDVIGNQLTDSRGKLLWDEAQVKAYFGVIGEVREAGEATSLT
jgi:hypothetical protein